MGAAQMPEHLATARPLAASVFVLACGTRDHGPTSFVTQFDVGDRPCGLAYRA